MIVEAEVRLVAFRGVRVAAQLQVDVAQLFEGARGARIELGGGAEIAQGRRQRLRRIAAALVRLAALQVGQHRAALQGDRAAVGLDRHERLPAAERFVPLDDQAAVFAVALDRLVGQDAGGRQAGQDDDAGDDLLQPDEDPRFYGKR